ncbi:hypothetical protein J2Z31_002785 [Sinorhizobium kostiense]|uniref:Uncharacterized protein n=1 Tax=Sinorhizobium kostiense TaxID=76747 RepID=A0ABS4R042_9HYPH|nr:MULTISPECIES: hypothetical protein [Sinorhizobium/Ensifer group]MBP2236271.1 hypothetical protein [Sinorhizobium kostiense]
MASTSPTSTLEGGISSAISSFKAAQNEATAQSLQVATEITKINGVANATKKIGPA